jgi:thiamine pyrophosphate-dependent acetolactate synthase large subunit-like protein
MTSLDAIGHVVRAAGNAPIIASLGHPAYDLFAAGDRPANFYTWGSMGLASSIGLGLALAQPRHRVHVLDGDGSLLMNLGSLATIGWKRPVNFVLVVLDNERYATTGGQDTATAHGSNLEAAARAMGFKAAVTVQSQDQLADVLEQTVSDGPWMIVAKVEDSTPSTKPPLDCVFIKQRFMAALGCTETATTGEQT